MNRQSSYPSDLTNVEWQAIVSHVPAPKPGGRAATYCRRQIVNAILFALYTGCPWRNLPSELPPWQSVYGYFRAWRADGTWDRIAKKLARTCDFSPGSQRSARGAMRRLRLVG